MVYVPFFVLFISCLVLLVKIIKSVSLLRDSVSIISKCVEELQTNDMVNFDNLKTDLADCRLSLLELSKELSR